MKNINLSCDAAEIPNGQMKRDGIIREAFATLGIQMARLDADGARAIRSGLLSLAPAP
jgi:hypothetical protein